MPDIKCCVLFNGAREHTLSADAKTMMRLVPGQNMIDMVVLEKVKANNEAFQHLEESGEIEVLPIDAMVEDDAGGTSVNIALLSVNEAKSLIETQFDITALQAMLEQETENNKEKGRVSVVKAINTQIEQINEAEKIQNSEK